MHLTPDTLLQIDRSHLWHPYSSMSDPAPTCPVRSAAGGVLTLEDGRELVDGMSSWWSAIHGYNVAEINAALQRQMTQCSHVMFGGLTHRPAVELAQRLLALTPEPLEKIFLADSGSIAVEVALKMALQYWIGAGATERREIAVLRGGYHGDTFATMALADPENGMHTLFGRQLQPHHFVERPSIPYGETWDERAMHPLQQLFERHHTRLAALILEPVVQGAGGMYFYHPEYLRQARLLCDRYGVLLIADEIATGFGRSGRLFACDHAGITPDILCIGKALTGGTLTLAATLTTERVASAISESGPLMHGPTFMGNPLACSAANASIELLLESPWQQRVATLEQWLRTGLAPCAALEGVAEVRVLGAIGVVEMRAPVEMAQIQPLLVEQGIWVRPFGKLVYLMPPYILDEAQTERLTRGVYRVLQQIANG
jgi:adenosylmethionine-8-amino-7-oxononanoate aminotransferase